MAADATEADTALIAELLQQDQVEAAWVRGESPPGLPRRRGDSDDDFDPGSGPAKRRKAPAKAVRAPADAPAAKPVKSAGLRGSGGRGVTLLDLIRCGSLKPGVAALRTEYKGTTYVGDLGPAGVIHFKGNFFDNPSGFSLHCKRLTTPGRKADDGWQSVCAGKRPLAELKAAALALRANGGDKEAAGDAPAPPAKTPRAAKALKAAPQQAQPAGPSAPPPLADPPPIHAPPPAASPTAYMQARPQRERHAPQRLVLADGGEAAEVDDLQLIEALPYAAAAAPLHLEVAPSAAALMDFHAHLCGAEVIGFLGGRFDPSTRTLRVLRALPAAQLVSRAAEVEVELDPAGMPALYEALEAEGLQAVGWYHSHPTFATQPSVRDCGNQGAYQSLFQGAPFVGAIVGPWHAADAQGVAQVTWFHVVPDEGAPSGYRPRQLAAAACAVPLRTDLLAEAAAQAARFAAMLLRTELREEWRGGVCKRAALEASLRHNLPATAASRALVGQVMAALDAAWAA